MKQGNQKIQIKMRHGILACLALLGILALAQSLSLEGADGFASGKVIMLNDQWEVAAEEQSGAAEYRFRIPDNADGDLLLCMKTYLPEFRVLLDDEPIYSFSDVYAIKGRSQHMVRIPLNSQGRLLAIRVEPGRYKSAMKQSQVGNAYLGTEHEAALKLLRDNFYALIFAVFALLMGMGSVIVGCWFRKSVSAEMLHCLMSFGVFVLITGIWVLTDSELLLFVTDKVATVSLLSFASFMIMPAFLLGFINDILGRRRIIDVLRWLFVIAAAAYLVNFLFQIFPGYLLLLPTHTLCICSVVIVIKTGRDKLKNGKNKTAQWIMAGFGVLSVCVVFALALFYIDPVSQYSNLYCLGILAFILCLMRAMLARLYGYVEETANMAAYKRLAYMDAMTGMQNRAAFMEVQRQIEADAGLSCIMLDINNLKQINDQYGHQKGDQAIIVAARVIRDVFKEAGTCFRIGGDEFVVFLKDRTVEQIEAALDRMKKRISMENQAGDFQIDIAAGYVGRRGSESVSQMVQRADAKMYEEKQRMKAEQPCP